MNDHERDPYYLRREPPTKDVPHPWAEFDCLHGSGLRNVCERHRFKAGYASDRSRRRAPCDCPCHNGEPKQEK
jgi:hypothetical protein